MEISDAVLKFEFRSHCAFLYGAFWLAEQVFDFFFLRFSFAWHDYLLHGSTGLIFTGSPLFTSSVLQTLSGIRMIPLPCRFGSFISFTLHRVVSPPKVSTSISFMFFPLKSLDHSVRSGGSTCTVSPAKNPLKVSTVSCCGCCGCADLRGAGIMLSSSFRTVGTITCVTERRLFASAFSEVAVTRYMSLMREMCTLPLSPSTEKLCRPPIVSAFSATF